jgi:two-component system CheB/CheR fusion protein
VLSGGGSDGSRGARAVRDAGGLVIVQDEATAQFDAMPRAARDAGIADWVLAPEEMPRVLVQDVRAVSDVAPRPNSGTPQGLRTLYRMLEDEFGLDFSHYKPSTVTRRIERRLQLSRVRDIDTYVTQLAEEREELDVLYRDLLIGVTRFFRNEEAFRLLEERILPELFAREGNTPLRIWVAGCATGEEVYSLAILAHELAPRFSDRQVKIFATDVHRGSLELATRGVYGEDAVANVSPERLSRYFIRRGDKYQVVPDVRQMVVFAPHNVIRDAPFTRVDLISCRNLLIYLQPAAQRKVLSLFHFALKRGGVVMLGPSESPGTLLNDFETLDKRWRVYRKYTDVRMPVGVHLQGTGRTQPPVGQERSLVASPRSPVSQLLSVYDALLGQHMPSSLLVNEHGELVHSFGGASSFLRVRDGRQRLEVVELVDPDLKMILTSGIARALRDTETSVYNGVKVSDGETTSAYRVSVRRVVAEVKGPPHVLITFEQADAREEPGAAPEVEIDLGQVSRDRLDEVEAELTHTKESLQAATEELETSNEELQAANEELLASNEELQSTNEELQSVNEELYSVNAEYQRKIADLTELTNDMENLLSSTEIGTIFLDRELRIRKFTSRMGDSFNLLPHDVGRSIETFAHNIEHPDLLDDLRRVTEDGEVVERELLDRRGRTFFLRILPYRAKGEINGVVLTLIDVSGLKAAEDALFRERYLLNSLLDSVPEAIYFKDSRGRIIRANRAMAARLSVADAEDAVGKTALELRSSAAADHEQDEIVLRTGKAQNYRLEQRRSEEGGESWELATRLPLTDREERIVGLIGIFRDVTEQKRADEKIQESIRRRDQFLAMLSHELRNPLGAVVTAMALVREGSEMRDKLLSIVERQTKHMARLLDDLLEASRVTQNKIELRMRQVDLVAIAKDAADAVRNTMNERGLTLTVRLDEGPLLVMGDDTRLLQIHINLLSNAAKYTPHGGHVFLSVSREAEQVVVKVRDDGVGIPAELLGQIFELFVQSRRTIDRSDGGLGLGLTLVKSLVEMHGGTVNAQSDGEGRGSEFVVRFPVVLASSESEERARPRPSARLKPGARIVVVEDNADGREALCELLSLAGYDCHTAGDGASGLSLVERIKPDAAILDLGLPVLDGLELARRLRSDPDKASMFLIALTGYGQRIDRDNALAAGFNEHMVKPVDTQELMRLLGDTAAERK